MVPKANQPSMVLEVATTAWTVGGALGKPAKYGARSCKVGVGTGGEPELRGLGNIIKN